MIGYLCFTRPRENATMAEVSCTTCVHVRGKFNDAITRFSTLSRHTSAYRLRVDNRLHVTCNSAKISTVSRFLTLHNFLPYLFYDTTKITTQLNTYVY